MVPCGFVFVLITYRYHKVPPRVYSPGELSGLAFSRAVEQDLLTDYKVVVLTFSEQVVEAPLQTHLASDENAMNISDATKIIGCWRALQNPERKTSKDGPIRPLARAIAFTNTIKASKRLDVHWGALIRQTIEQLPCDERSTPVRCETLSVPTATILELSRFGGQVTSAFRDTVADRTVLPTECRVKGTIPHAGRLRAAETAAIAGSCTRVAGGGRAARSRRSAKDDRIRGSLRVPRSGGKDRSGPQ